MVVTGFDIAGATDDWLGIGTAKLVLRRVVVLVVVVVVVVTCNGSEGLIIFSNGKGPCSWFVGF